MSRRQRAGLILLALLLLAILVPPYITLNRLKSRLAGALAGGLGRPVKIGEITLRLLPQPGFELSNFSVADDPAFSAEPMLQADSVVASLRLSSLWRGRVEIARLSLENASLNLVRNASGEWNLQALLRRAGSTPVAPTTRRTPETRLRFPYVETSDGRINFKVGNDKKVWAIAEADFALWLESEDEWRMRLEGRPVRTDLNLSDTGTLKLDGQFQLRPRNDASLKFSGELADSQIRELVRFVSGEDHGWAGKLTTDFSVQGTPAKLQVTDDTVLEDFRRYDIMGGEVMRFRAHCAAGYDLAAERLGDIDCSLPLGDGRVTAAGTVTRLFGERQYALTLNAQQVGANEVVALLRHAKKDMAGDLSATGQVDGAFHMDSSGAGTIFRGQGQASNVKLRSVALAAPVTAGNVQFGFLSPQPERRRRRQTEQPQAQQPFVIRPAQIPLGAPQPLQIAAQATKQQYAMSVAGGASIPRLLELARVLGLHPPAVQARGNVTLALSAEAPWTGFPSPRFTGTAALQDASAEIAGMASPLTIDSATLDLGSDLLQVAPFSTRIAGSTVTGSLSLPRGCAHPGDCRVTFDAHADRVDLDQWNRLLNTRLESHPWYQVVTGTPKVESVPARLRVEGNFTADRLIAKRLVATNVSGHMIYAERRLAITSLSANALGGRTTGGTLRADFTADPPQYEVNGRAENISLQELAQLTNDRWGTGKLDGRYGLTLAGWSFAEMTDTAEGGGEFTWRNGTLRHVSLDSQIPLQVRQFSGILRLKNRILTVSQGLLWDGHHKYVVTGKAGFDRRVEFTVANGVSGGYLVQGLLASPRVQALKTQPQTASKQE